MFVFVGLNFICTFEPDMNASNDPKFESSRTCPNVVIATLVPLCTNNTSSEWKLLLAACDICAVNLNVLNESFAKLSMFCPESAVDKLTSALVISGVNTVALECDTTSTILPAPNAESKTTWLPLPAV